jgi:hypothetical protein
MGTVSKYGRKHGKPGDETWGHVSSVCRNYDKTETPTSHSQSRDSHGSEQY